MSLNLLMLLVLLSFLSSGVIITTVAPTQTLPGCRDRCGHVSIPYPFGEKQECFKDDGYLITCRAGDDGIFKPYQGTGNIQVLELSLDGKAKFKSNYYAYDCFNSAGKPKKWFYWFDMRNSPFWFSPIHNTFTAVGCDAIATIRDFVDDDFMSGCMSVCTDQGRVRNGSCSGIGCCQTSIPWGLKRFNVTLESLYNHTRTSPFNPCSFAFLAEKDWYTFTISDLSTYTFETSNIPMVMDWAIGKETCEEAQQDTQSYACGPNTNCSNSPNGPGYWCYCKEGFEGNPYLPQGCQDINECEGEHKCYETATCNNTVGNYSCLCPKGYDGDGWTDGTRCTQNLKAIPLLKIIAGVGTSFVFVLFSICFAYWGIQRRRVIRCREKFFQQNGGLLLQQQIASRQGVQDNARIFTIEELSKATNNFDESRIIGQGGHGTVYRGILSNGEVVAVKKSKEMDKGQITEFINEVNILSQINHRNVVKLFGCCLETEIPLLVYEFISNGTLFQYIHNENQLVSISWRNRLRIATETAGALAYLHSYHSTPILHRDVKSSNILLDDNYVAKLSDFGASRLVPLDQAQASTLIQGTMGYLDPECFQTGQLIDKSDVYSFGVVLAELLTRQKPILTKESEDPRILAMHFVSSLKDNNLFQILDYQVLNEGNNEHIMAVSKLVRKCLEMKGENRPTMKEVAMELESLRMSYEHPWIQHNPEETESLLGESSTSSAACVTALSRPPSRYPIWHTRECDPQPEDQVSSDQPPT